jgi:subtilisin family serine protease
MQLEATFINPKMDIRLQRVLDRRSRGIATHLTAATALDEIGVIAKVRRADVFGNRTEIRPGALVGTTSDGFAIVTARVPVTQVETVRGFSEVVSLKAAQRLRPMLAATLTETHARPDLLPPAGRGDFGRGVVIGIIDFGCDFVHKNFRNRDGSTRIRAIWDQTAPPQPGSPFGYGRVYRAGEINAALASRDPYAALGYGPEPDHPFRPPGTHGTHVMDIAAGNGLGSDQPGLASKADLIFVEVASTDVPWSGEQVVGKNFGDSVQVLEAINFIFTEAGNTPCVINISLGTNGGSHDGTSLVEQGIDAVVSAAPNRAVVIAASNSYADHIHASGQVGAGQIVDLSWQVNSSDLTFNELELWYPGRDAFGLELLDPRGVSVGTVALGDPSRRLVDNGRVLALIAHRANDPNNGDNTIGIFLDRGLPAGVWTVRLHDARIVDGNFHAWIERDDPGQSSFVGPLQNDRYTLGSISCSHLGISVGSYDAHRASTPLSYFSSSGPTRDGQEKPEISAPGHGVWAARSRTLNGVTQKSGTSMAAPAVTGTIALMMAEARSRGFNLSVQEIQSILADTARPGGAWDERYGSGRIDAAACVNAVIQMTPGV